MLWNKKTERQSVLPNRSEILSELESTLKFSSWNGSVSDVVTEPFQSEALITKRSERRRWYDNRYPLHRRR